MKLIAILPTGDWAEVENVNDVQIVTLTDTQFNHLCNEGVADNTLLQIDSTCTEANINSILGLEN